MLDEITQQIVINLLLSSPNYVIFWIGFVVCVRRWPVHPNISLLLVCSLVSLTAGSLLGNVGLPVAWELVHANGGEQDTAKLATGLVRAIAAVPYAIGFALMLYAALAERDGTPPDTSST